MDDAAQAEAYARADFSSVNQTFVERFLERFPSFQRGEVLDLGAGPADIPIRLAQKLPAVRVTAADGAAAMVALAEDAVAAAGLGDRVRPLLASLPVPGRFDAVISNSLLHHLADPMALWANVRAAARPSAPVFVVDLFRPPTPEAAERIVHENAEHEHPILKRDFYHSLLAAYTEQEVRTQLDRAGLGRLGLAVVSERHFAVFGRL